MSGTAARRAQAGRGRWREEFRDFLGFVAHPRFGPRLPGRRPGGQWWEDWFPPLSCGRMLQWAAFLWGVNLFFLGPIAVGAAALGGAAHRLNIENIPWLQALVWAPVVEELVFRYGLRRPQAALWLVPAAVVAMLYGPNLWSVWLVAAILLLCWLPYLGDAQGGARPAGPTGAAGFLREGPCKRLLRRARTPMAWRNRLRYRRGFPWVFHLAMLAFAAVHLHNFSMPHTPYWLMPLLVLPQWMTGLVLGWMRTRRGIGASMLLHGLFNSGPLLVAWVFMQVFPQMTT